MSFIEYKTTRAKKPLEELVASKEWQAKARRLYLPIDTKQYGLSIKKWEEDGKKRHAITWKQKPYCKLLLNDKGNQKDFAMVEVNTQKGLAIQVDPSDFKKCYISIPKGALQAFPKGDARLEYKKQGSKITVTKK